MSSALYLKVAVRAVQEGGKVLMRQLGKLKKSQVRMKGRYDWVTDADHASEKVILRVIKRAFRDHAIQAEESSPGAKPAAAQWLVDPLDGTVNYMHGFPMFCISVALALEGKLEVGVVYDPLRRELFTARRGHGAWLNGKRIRVSRHSSLRKSLVCTGFPFRAKRCLDLYLISFRKVFMETGAIRRAGSAALDLSYVACGRADGFWEMALSAWDIAAGALLIEEAGGKVSDFLGGSRYLRAGHIVAGNPAVHRQLLRVIKPVFQGRI